MSIRMILTRKDSYWNLEDNVGLKGLLHNEISQFNDSDDAILLGKLDCIIINNNSSDNYSVISLFNDQHHCSLFDRHYLQTRFPNLLNLYSKYKSYKEGLNNYDR